MKHTPPLSARVQRQQSWNAQHSARDKPSPRELNYSGTRGALEFLSLRCANTSQRCSTLLPVKPDGKKLTVSFFRTTSGSNRRSSPNSFATLTCQSNYMSTCAMTHKPRFRAACWCLVVLLAVCYLHKNRLSCLSIHLLCGAGFFVQHRGTCLYRANPARTRESGANSFPFCACLLPCNCCSHTSVLPIVDRTPLEFTASSRP